MLLFTLLIECGNFSDKLPSQINTKDRITLHDSVITEEIDLKKYYDEYALNGMFALYDPEKNVCKIFNKKYFTQLVSPASTFNIITTLISMEEGVLENSSSVISFDGYHKSKYPNKTRI